MNLKKDYLNKEIWVLIFGGAFGRANVYKTTASEELKGDFKTSIKELVERMLPLYKNSKPSDTKHVLNIKRIEDASKLYKKIFANGRLNFGVSQKMLNLYLKYNWCVGEISAPPHFPVDRIIQEKLISKAKKHKIKPIKLEPWTQYKNETKYLQVINLAREVGRADPELKDLKLAEIELKLFSRR